MQSKKVVTRLNGGLGNQMFQYAFGKALATKMNASLFIETGMLDRDPLRSFALSDFRISAETINSTELRKRVVWPFRLVKRLHWLPTFPGCLRYLSEKSFSYDPSISLINQSVCAEGYWQSPKYFESISNALHKEFQLVAPLTRSRQETASKISSVNAISLHIRRGDYASNPQTKAFHGLCSVDWYMSAMRHISQKIDQPYFFVFSDDITWSQQNIRSDYPIHFVEQQPDGHDFEDMHLISMCKHHIIANSSFSWWGAWLNQKHGKRVIAPAKWFNQATHDTKDLLPPEWQRM